MESSEENSENTGTSDNQNSGKRKNSTDFNDEKLELLKDHYFSLREETHLRIELQNKRLTQGLTVVGAIIGYGLLSKNYSAITITPFILGILFIESARMYSHIGRLATEMYNIEEELQEVTSLFRWEHEYGGLYGVSDSLVDLSWNRVPIYGLIFVSIVAYVGAVWISVRFWPPDFGTWYVNSTDMSILMSLYGLFIMIIWYSAHQSVNQMPSDLNK